MYIYQEYNWPAFEWDSEELEFLLGQVRNLQGKIVGKMAQIGFDFRNEANLSILILDVVKSSEIEGEVLDKKQVRSSIARRLGMDVHGLIPSDRDVDGLVDMMLDATQHHTDDLSKKRLFEWHDSLFPTGKSGRYPIITGGFRNDKNGPMQVVSGAMGKEKIYFQAPEASILDSEIEQFVVWFNKKEKIDPIIKSAIAHLWFVTLHPFEDGNGRMARAITDMLLARADGTPQRFYSMSAQIRKERKGYYGILEKTQKGDIDITPWLYWFLNCLLNALNSSEEVLSKIVFKHQFWTRHASHKLNERQLKMLDKALNDFYGKLNTAKWAKMMKCSSDTALRDIQDLVKKGILEKSQNSGRSTHYTLIKTL